MALRDTMRSSLPPFLGPDETVEQVFAAQTVSQYLFGLGIIPFIIANDYRIVAVTDRRIVVLDAGKWSAKKARRGLYEFPRQTRLGPGSGIWHVIPAGPEKLRVHRRFFKDMAAADAASGTGSSN